MSARILTVALLLGLGVLHPGGARACGFGEAPGDCGGDTPETEAKYMLGRVVTALKADKAKALEQFRHGENGFRTVDTYVFCVGPDGVISAHPSAALQGQDVHDLHDKTGNYFIKTMMQDAKPGQISVIKYLFPRPGATEAVPKTTYYTRAGDQVCGVGVYDGDDSPAAAMTTQARLLQLRQRLTAAMPASLGADWSAFLQAVDADSTSKAEAFAKVREQVRAAETAFSLDQPPNANR